ncbi:MAG: hypothetical protein AB7R89_29160 [Dehalococcoidia bacterium]
MAIRQAHRRQLPKRRRRDEDNDTLTRVGGIIVWVGVPLIAWGALIWAAIQAARSML